jgi:hypothetical protein
MSGASGPSSSPAGDARADPNLDRAPASAGGSAGSAPRSAGGVDPTWNDPTQVLTELAQLDAELKSRRPLTSIGAPTGPPASERPSEALPVEGGPPTPHLEERIELASASLVQIGAGLRAIDNQWAAIRAEAGRLEQQMDGAAEELEHLRERGGAAPAGPAPQVLLASPTEVLAARVAARRAPVAAPYVEFTADRYRRTVNAVKKRRRSMAVWTIGLAAVISGALLTFTYLAHEAAPPLWLAVLPLVWLIPVPFFFVSFLSTQRIIAQDALELSEGS